MSTLTIPFALVQARRNPVRAPVRNLSITQGDDTVLELSCYETDSGAPLNLVGAVVHVALYEEPGAVGLRGWGRRDYGSTWSGDWHGHHCGALTWQSRGAVTQALAGLAEVELPGALTAEWLGRYAFELRVDTGRGGVTEARGVLQVLESGYRQPVRSGLVPLKVHDAIFGTFVYPVVSPGDATLTDGTAPPAASSPVLGLGVLGSMVLGQGSNAGASAALGEGVLGRMVLGKGALSNSASAPELGVGQLGSLVLGGTVASPPPTQPAPTQSASPPPAPATPVVNQPFTFTQTEPRAVWLIRHTFTRRPMVETTDLNSNPIEGAVDHPDATTVVIMFSEAVSGRAYLS